MQVTMAASTDLGKTGKRMEHSASVECFTQISTEETQPIGNRKQQPIYQSVLHEMDNEQSQYIDALLRSKRAAKNGSLGGHYRTSSDLNLIKQSATVESNGVRIPKERHTHNLFLQGERVNELFHEELEADERLEILSMRETPFVKSGREDASASKQE